MRKGITSKKEERAIVFTKEIFGMGLLLFSVLSLLCVLTGDAVFYTLGKSVQGFFMGTFGYYSFYVLFGFIVFGLKMVIGRPVFSDDARRVVLRLGTLAYAIMAIIQIATKYSRELNFSQFFSLTYGGGNTYRRAFFNSGVPYLQACFKGWRIYFLLTCDNYHNAYFT